MNVDDRMGSCRDKGRMWGRVGAWCLSWWQRDPVGTAWSKQVAPQRGQAPGPIHFTLGSSFCGGERSQRVEHHDKVEKLLVRLKRDRRGQVALLGLVLVVDLF